MNIQRGLYSVNVYCMEWIKWGISGKYAEIVWFCVGIVRVFGFGVFGMGKGVARVECIRVV